jgi:hypothetical protein
LTPSEPSDKTCRIGDLDRQSQARQQLGAVLRDYNPAPGNYNPRVKLLAAEAHGQLGALDPPSRRPPVIGPPLSPRHEPAVGSISLHRSWRGPGPLASTIPASCCRLRHVRTRVKSPQTIEAQRRHRAVLRHLKYEHLLPRTHQRRRRLRRRSQPVPPDLHHHPTPPSPPRPHPPRRLPGRSPGHTGRPYPSWSRRRVR